MNHIQFHAHSITGIAPEVNWAWFRFAAFLRARRLDRGEAAVWGEVASAVGGIERDVGNMKDKV